MVDFFRIFHRFVVRLTEIFCNLRYVEAIPWTCLVMRHPKKDSNTLPGAVTTEKWVVHLRLLHLHRNAPDFDMEFVERSLPDRYVCEEMVKDSVVRKVQITM